MWVVEIFGSFTYKKVVLHYVEGHKEEEEVGVGSSGRAGLTRLLKRTCKSRGRNNNETLA